MLGNLERITRNQVYKPIVYVKKDGWTEGLIRLLIQEEGNEVRWSEMHIKIKKDTNVRTNRKQQKQCPRSHSLTELLCRCVVLIP